MLESALNEGRNFSSGNTPHRKPMLQEQPTLNEGRNFSSGNTLRVGFQSRSQETLNEGRNFSSGNTISCRAASASGITRSMRAGTLVPATPIEIIRVTTTVNDAQ